MNILNAIEQAKEQSPQNTALFDMLQYIVPNEVLVMPRQVFAVDGDIIAYKTAAVCEEHFEGACASIIDTTFKNISTDTGTNLFRVYLSGRQNFRKQVAKTLPYKGNRATMVAPKYLDFCKEYLQSKYKAVIMDEYEADDCVATDMTQTGAIHCGVDKDIYQIAGRHYNYTKADINERWVEISEDEAAIRLYRQVLMGDRSDNVPGLPRIGEKKAEAAIQDALSAREDAIQMYNAVCREALPGVDPMEYFNEQFALIAMISSVNLPYDNTIFIAPKEGEFEVDTDSEFSSIEEKQEIAI